MPGEKAESPPDDISGPNTRAHWPIWRIVLRGVATLEEIESSWDMMDVADANEALDVSDDVKEWSTIRQRQLDAAKEGSGQRKTISL